MEPNELNDGEASRPKWVGRHLGTAQAERRDRILAAARELASVGGYGAVNIRAVAERSGLSRPTVYRYFATSDHLLGEMTLQWGGTLLARLKESTPQGTTVGSRIHNVFRAIIEEAASHPGLISAVVASLMSSDPNAKLLMPNAEQLLQTLLATAFSDLPAGIDWPVSGKALGLVLFADLILLSSGRSTPEAVIDEMEAIAQRLFGDHWDAAV